MKDLHVTEIIGFEPKTKQKLPLFQAGVPAGYPSPADDFVEKKLDLNEFLIKHPAATFLVRVEGESMIEAGIHTGDILVVDRSLEPSNGKIVIAALNGDLTVKKIRKSKKKLYLAAQNPESQDIEITDDSDLVIWGVVSWVLHRV